MGKNGHGRRVRKVDGNQREIIDGLRSVGVFVEDTHTLGQGFPDILAYNTAKERWQPIEIKASEKSRLTPDEVIWWEMTGSEPVVAWDLKTAFRAAGVETLPFDDPSLEEMERDLLERVKQATGGQVVPLGDN